MLFSFQISCEWLEKMPHACDHRVGVDDGRRFFLYHAGDGGLHRGAGASAASFHRHCATATRQIATSGTASHSSVAEMQGRRFL